MSNNYQSALSGVSADDFLSAHAADTAAFQAIIHTALAGIRALAFPLGGPSAGYDVLDITATMKEWLTPRSSIVLAQAAEDAACEAALEAEGDFADWQYDNRREMEAAP